jgi:1,4-alpha-glucan branching enzyme
MGNEFGHPEWIDLPREGNGWSYHYCRRQWSLADNPRLKYGFLQEFEKRAVALCKSARIFTGKARLLKLDNQAKVLVYQKGKAVFAFNFHPENSYEGCFIDVPEMGEYEVVMSTDDYCFGGFGRIYHQRYSAVSDNGAPGVKLYLPSRTAVALRAVEN